MKHILPLVLALLISTISSGQEPTPASERLKAFQSRSQAINQSLFSGVSLRSVGPTVMSGRVVDLAVDPSDATHFFVAYASGGLWETKNNGQSFDPLFDDQAVMTIGAIAVNWQDTSIWVGTGEVNSSRSSYSGVGMYFSPDQGKTWEHRGLADSHHIGRVIVHPGDANTVWVASLGRLYTEGDEEGLFKTTDGGKTWKHVLSESVGAVDLVIHPENPDILYAALWDRDRKAWNFQGNGPSRGTVPGADA
ncbi:MAG: glycosyl hydrolase, partial [Bacteroidetes bacterium]|nr:glycosyl hydrolase [Bacteroidota bacterium]